CRLSEDLPLFPQNPILFPEAGQLFALGGRGTSLTVGPIGAGALPPLAPGRFRPIEGAGGATHGLTLVEHESDGLSFEVVIEPSARPPLGVSTIGLDIVSLFRQTSTKPDQAHNAGDPLRRPGRGCHRRRWTRHRRTRPDLRLTRS